MKKLSILILLISLLGCDYESNQMPEELKEAKPPLTIRTINEEGLILSDGNGKLYSYRPSFYFARILIKAEVTEGFVLSNPQQTQEGL